ncbi:MAG: hypothetical protein U9Q75_03180 [Pseudomonadota bacterium]|nr:hypothetical protein [Pseudomonadota bacterium]
MKSFTKSPLPAITLLLSTLFSGLSIASGTNNFGEITLEAGSSGTCLSSPCKVYFVMPPGSGSYVVLANNMEVGSYPAGQTVSLGGYWTGITRFKVVDSDVDLTILNVIGRE